MAEILHQLIGSLYHYLQGFIHLRWCRISAINSINKGEITHVLHPRKLTASLPLKSYPKGPQKEMTFVFQASFFKGQTHVLSQKRSIPHLRQVHKLIFRKQRDHRAVGFFVPGKITRCWWALATHEWKISATVVKLDHFSQNRGKFEKTSRK